MENTLEDKLKSNILYILGIHDKEDVISNILCYCLNNSLKFRNIFLEKICDYSNDEIQEINKDTIAKTRISTISGIPDIVILIRKHDANEIIVIENKLLAGEGWEQTKRYSSKECKEDLKKSFEIDKAEFRFVYFSLFPDDTADNTSDFVSKHYNELIKHIENESFENQIVNQLLSDLSSLYSKFYESGKISDEDIIIEKLRQEDPLDSAYLYFKSFIAKISMPNGLQFKFTYNSKLNGRHYYGALFSKKEWEPSSYGEKIPLNENTYSIHFEPQYNVLGGILNFYIHYEPNPYKPVSKIREIGEKYDLYLRRRNEFVKNFHSEAKSIQRFKSYNGSNQIGKVVFDFQKKKLKDVREIIEKLLVDLSLVIDKTQKITDAELGRKRIPVAALPSPFCAG